VHAGPDGRRDEVELEVGDDRLSVGGEPRVSHLLDHPVLGAVFEVEADLLTGETGLDPGLDAGRLRVQRYRGRVVGGECLDVGARCSDAAVVVACRCGGRRGTAERSDGGEHDRDDGASNHRSPRLAAGGAA
jgi:hypothetical protein